MRINLFNTTAYFAIGVFIYLIITKLTDNPSLFINPAALVVVVGGLFVAGLASFPFVTLLDAFRNFWQALNETVREPVAEARELVRLATIGQRGLTRLESEVENVDSKFIRSGLELILDGITPKVFQAVMQKRVTEYQERCSRSVTVMLTFSKFAPALGLAATVLGLVQLLSNLGTVEMNDLGTGMAVALSGTFYGIIVANLIFQPMAELIQMKAESEVKLREMILDGLHSLLERQDPLIIGEIINSYLPDAKRIAFSDEIEDANPAAGKSGAP